MLQQQGRAVDVRAVGRSVLRGTRRAALTLTGFVLVGLGLAGLVLPVLPGWLLVIAGFAVLSREYSWADSGLAAARRHATRGGRKLRSLVTRHRRPAVGFDEPPAEVIIDLTGDSEHSPDSEPSEHSEHSGHSAHSAHSAEARSARGN